MTKYSDSDSEKSSKSSKESVKFVRGKTGKRGPRGKRGHKGKDGFTLPGAAAIGNLDAQLINTADPVIVTFSNGTSFPTNSTDIVIGTDTILFRRIGLYLISGTFFGQSTDATTTTSIIVTPNVISGSAIIQPAVASFTDITPGLVFNGTQYFLVQVTSANTAIQFTLQTDPQATIAFGGGQIVAYRIG